MADTVALRATVRDDVGVRVPLRVPSLCGSIVQRIRAPVFETGYEGSNPSGATKFTSRNGRESSVSGHSNLLWRINSRSWDDWFETRLWEHKIQKGATDGK